MNRIISFLVGIATGILSAFGVGGGSLLLIYLTSIASVSQHEAQGINLLYFLPASVAALPSHHKNKLLHKGTILPAVLAGLAAAAIAAFASNHMDTQILRKLFGVFLLYISVRELLRYEKKPPNQ